MKAKFEQDKFDWCRKYYNGHKSTKKKKSIRAWRFIFKIGTQRDISYRQTKEILCKIKALNWFEGS